MAVNRLPNYKHVTCDECGGIIGMRDNTNFCCNRCTKIFQLTDLTYDRLMINSFNGWIFPVINREEEYIETLESD